MNDRKEQVFSRDVVVGVLDSLMESCHVNALEKGFYDDYEQFVSALDSVAPDTPTDESSQGAIDAYLGFCSALNWLRSTTEQAAIARMHSELSEWVEAIRHAPTHDRHCPEFWNHEIEAADLIIRVLDTCGRRGYRIGAALLAKMEYNRTRPYKHGKNS